MHTVTRLATGALEQPLRFLGVGVLNTLVGLTLIYLARFGLGWADVPANILGYAVGLTVSFSLNRRWTFRHEGRLLSAQLRFLAAFAVAYAANLAALLLLTRGLGVASIVAHPAGMVVYTSIFYILSRYFVFPPGGRATDRINGPDRQSPGVAGPVDTVPSR
jgi:putative flippase GtrA